MDTPQKESTRRGACVYRVGETHEVDALLLEVAHQIDELLDAPPEAVELPDDECVVLPQLFERFLR